MDCGFDGEAVFLTEDRDGAVLDELVGPADADDRGFDALVGQMLNDGGAVAVVEDMVFHRAEDFATAGEKFDRGGVERLDPTGIDDRRGDTEFFQFLGCGQGEFTHVAESEDRRARAVAQNLGFSDLEKLWFFRWNGSGAGAAGVADGGGAFVVGDRPEHVGELGFVLRLHVDDAWDGTEVADVKEAVVRGSVVAGEAGAVHAEGDIEILQRNVVNDHVISALHEGAVNRDEGLHALCGEAAGEKRGMFFGDADIEEAVRMPFGEMDEACAGGHGGGDGDDFVIRIGEVSEFFTEKFRVGRGGGGDGFAGIEVEFSEAVEFVRLLECGRIAFAFRSENVKQDGLVLGF